MPSVVLGKARREEGGEGGSAVPCSGYAHRKSFVLLGKPAGSQREGIAEAGSGYAQKDSHGQDFVEGFYE